MSSARASFAHIFDRHSVGNCWMIFFRKYFHFPISVQQCCVAQSGPTTHRTDIKWLNNQFAGTETNGKINRQHHSQWPMWMAGKTNSNFNFMQIILTKSNKMKLLKQIGHLRLLDMCACVCRLQQFLVSLLYIRIKLYSVRCLLLDRPEPCLKWRFSICYFTIPMLFFFTIFLHSIPIQDNCEQFSQICNSMFLRCDLQNHCHWFRKPLPINIRERWRRESTFEPEHTHYSPLLFTRSQSLHNTLFRHFSDFVPNRSEILANWIDFTHCLECLKTSGSGRSIEWLGGNTLTQQTHNCLIKLSAQCSLNGECIQHS